MQEGERGDEVEAAEALEWRARCRHCEVTLRSPAASACARACAIATGERSRPDDLADMRREVALDRAVAAAQAEDAVRAAGAGRAQELARAALVHAAEQRRCLDPAASAS